ncbi:MAG: cell wall-binding repeat-containing protein [Catenulispora sp.]|nr:cell wall-binding repeat-containing protein [Catenulispora sp.]
MHNALSGAGYAVTRFSGADRYATARAVADKFPAPKAVGVATGSGFADALTGGAAMAALGQPLLLTDPKSLKG